MFLNFEVGRFLDQIDDIYTYRCITKSNVFCKTQCNNNIYI